MFGNVSDGERWSGRSVRARLACLAGVAIAWTCVAAPVAQAKKPVISISEFTANPASVFSASETTLTASVSGASTCTLSSAKPIAGLPATFPCETGGVDRALEMPANKGASTVSYTITLTATAGSAKAIAKTTVSVRPESEGQGTGRGVAVGTEETCAVLSSGAVECWGSNQEGALGYGPTILERPAQVEGITDATQVTIGHRSACALLTTGHIECWGSDQQGQLGDGKDGGSTNTPVEVSGITDAIQVTAGPTHICAVLSSGQVKCWGNGDEGQLGDGATTSSDTPVEALGVDDATEVAAGESHTCATLSTGHVECWGGNAEGQLGDGAELGSDTPVEVAGITQATQVAAGLDHTCALLATGHVECWGSNDNGQIGANTFVGHNFTTPAEALEITNAVQVTAGYDDSCALLATGEVKCWGDGRWGQLGDGGTTRSLLPVGVSSITDATQIATGTHTCAQLSTGHIDCWGYNEGGALGVAGKFKAKRDYATEPQQVLFI